MLNKFCTKLASLSKKNRNSKLRPDSGRSVENVTRTISMDDSHAFICNRNRSKTSITFTSVPFELISCDRLFMLSARAVFVCATDSVILNTITNVDKLGTVVMSVKVGCHFVVN